MCDLKLVVFITRHQKKEVSVTELVWKNDTKTWPDKTSNFVGKLYLVTLRRFCWVVLGVVLRLGLKLSLVCLPVKISAFFPLSAVLLT